MNSLKIYYPNPDKSFTKAKLARLKQEQTEVMAENVPTGYVSANHFKNDNSAFRNDFSLLPEFVPTDTLEHLNNCGKYTKNQLMPWSSLQVLKVLDCSHLFTICKSQVPFQKMLYISECFSGPRIENLSNTK